MTLLLLLNPKQFELRTGDGDFKKHHAPTWGTRPYDTLKKIEKDYEKLVATPIQENVRETTISPAYELLMRLNMLESDDERGVLTLKGKIKILLLVASLDD